MAFVIMMSVSIVYVAHNSHYEVCIVFRCAKLPTLPGPNLPVSCGDSGEAGIQTRDLLIASPAS